MSNSTKLAVFNLPVDVRESQVKELFRKFGRMREMILRQNRGATYAFIEFDDPRDAEDALDRRNDYSFAGKRLRVEYSRPPPRKEAPMMKDAFYRVKVTGLPRTASWQDLKDFMRAGGDVRFTDVEGGVGTAGFSSNVEMERAIRELDDTKFRARNGDTAYVRVKEDMSYNDEHGDRGRGGESRRDDRRSESRGRSHGRNRSRSRGRSGSAAYHASKPRSYSRSRSRK